jgi:hypothetical protein
MPIAPPASNFREILERDDMPRLTEAMPGSKEQRGSVADAINDSGVVKQAHEK